MQRMHDLACLVGNSRDACHAYARSGQLLGNEGGIGVYHLPDQ